MNAPKVMIVDDNAMNVQLASFLLDSAGFTVRSVDDTAVVLATVKSFAPDVILMDIQMPGMDGLELTRRLREDAQTRHIVIVAFTAYAMKGDEARMRAAGCDGYLPKPINVATFAAEVRAFTDAAARP